MFETKSLAGWDVVCKAATNLSGIAACAGMVPGVDAAFDSTYRAVFATTPTYLASTATASFK